MPISLRVYVAGPVTVEVGGKQAVQGDFPGRQGLLAFVRLAFTREVAVSRDELGAVLWPDGLPKASDTALHSIISKLRTLLAQLGLDKSEVLPTALGCYQLNLPAHAWVDVEEGIASLHQAEDLLKAGQHRAAWAAAEVAYHICKRPLLAGEAGPWVVQQRERLALSLARAAECLGEIYIWNQEPAVAVNVAEDALAAQPYRETAYRLLMRAHAAAGNRAEALWVYERCRKLFADELGVSPSAETSAVHLGILNQDK